MFVCGRLQECLCGRLRECLCGRLRECLCVAGCGNDCVWQAAGMIVCGRLRE